MGYFLANLFYRNWHFNPWNSIKFRIKSNYDYWAISRNFVHQKSKFLSIKFHLTAIIIITFLIFISHLGNPYQAEDENRLIIFMLILLTSFFIWVSLNHSLYNLSPGKLSKHDIESFFNKIYVGNRFNNINFDYLNSILYYDYDKFKKSTKLDFKPSRFIC